MTLTRRALATQAMAASAMAMQARAQQPPTLVIGGMLETSGVLATLGSEGLDGAQLAVDGLNAVGKGPRLKLVNVDTDSDESKAVTAALRLIEREGAVAIIGPVSSASNLAILDVVQNAHVPLLSNGAASAIVTPAQDRRWVFQVALSDLLAVRTCLAFMRARTITKVAIIAPDNADGSSGVTTWNEQATTSGIRIVATQRFSNLDQDMTPQLASLRSSGADATVLWAAGPAQAVAIKSYRQLGFTAPLFGSPGTAGPSVLKLAGPAANGVLFPAPKLYIAGSLPASDPQKPIIQSFTQAFTARYARPPSPYAGYGFDAVHMVHTAAMSSAGNDQTKLRDAVEMIADWPAVSGTYSYSPDDHNGMIPGSAVMQTIVDGAYASSPA